MASLFEIGKSGVQAYRQALSVTGQNIANVNTEGYNKRAADLEEIPSVQGGVTNVSDHWIMINLKGNKVYDLLSKSCPYNFNDYKKKKGSVAQTIVNHIDVILHNKEDNNLNLFVRRSFSEDLWLWLNDSARFI